MMRNIEAKVLDWTRRQALLAPGFRVLAALSGGADSVCLLRVLLALRDQLGISVAAGHYNHQLRGAESDRDEVFVRSFCERMGVPLVVDTGDVAGAASRSGRSVEATAREMRYVFLERTAAELGANAIATGHHADDNIETVLLHLVRGAGLRGLAGIPPRRGAIVRPLLAVARQEILDYLADLGQDFVEDATNQDTDFRRNALRHQVLPILCEMNPSLAQTVLRQSEVLRRDAYFLDSQAQGIFEGLCLQGEAGVQCAPLQVPVGVLSDLPVPLASRVVQFAIREAGGEAEEIHVRQVLDIAESEDPSALTMIPGLVVRREYDRLVFTSQTEQTTAFAPQTLQLGEVVSIPEAGVQVTLVAELEEKQAKLHTFLFQKASLCGKISVRPRKEGDKIRLSASSGTKTVKKYMIERKIPARKRDTWPVFADEHGVIAVYGIGTDTRVAPCAGEETLGIVVEELEHA